MSNFNMAACGGVSERVEEGSVASKVSKVDTKQAVYAVIAAFLGWTLDAFDFFILILTIDNIADYFGVSITLASFSVTLTLCTRAIGAFIFGRMADHYGRKPALITVVLLYSCFAALTGLAWSFASFMVIRALFGIAMGGEWGIGSSLAMETIPNHWRGWVSGLLQSGYPFGFFLATVLFLFGFHTLGWRGMFFVGASPAVLTIFIALFVKESPAFNAMKQSKKVSIFTVISNHGPLVVYGMVLMTALMFFSHGTQDIYVKLFLGDQKNYSHRQMSNASLIFNAFAIVGGILFGHLSQKIGRRYAIITCCFVSLAVLWPWSHGSNITIIVISASIMQVGVQGAFGVVPVHLNELSPREIRATYPGFVYQLGNLIASVCIPLQTFIAHRHGDKHGGDPDYGFALVVVEGLTILVLLILTLFGPEAHNVPMVYNEADDSLPSKEAEVLASKEAEALTSKESEALTSEETKALTCEEAEVLTSTL